MKYLGWTLCTTLHLTIIYIEDTSQFFCNPRNKFKYSVSLVVLTHLHIWLKHQDETLQLRNHIENKHEHTQHPL